jgi:uncharacterized membrane protein
MCSSGGIRDSLASSFRVFQLGLRSSPHLLFAVIAATTGVALVFLTPPLQVADEQCHFIRTASLLNGQLLPVRGPAGEYGLKVASRLLQDGSLLFGRTPFHPERRYDRSLIATIRARPVHDGPDVLTRSCPNTSLFSPVGYAPQLVGIGVARLCRASTPVMVWAGRLANLCLFVLTTILALRLLSARGDVLLVLALMPMTLFQAASLSADAVLNALSFLFVAYTVRLLQCECLRVGQVGRLLLIGVAIGLIKTAYAPLTLVGWTLVPAALRAWRQERRRWPLALTLLVPACSLAAAGSWSAAAVPCFDPREWKPAIDAVRQLAWVRAHPAAILRRFAASLTHLPDHSAEFIGVLGWLDTPIPRVWREIYGLLLVVTALGWVRGRPTADASPPIGLGTRCLFLTAAFTSVMAGYVAILFYWENVGDLGPINFQGRYLIPTALPVLLSLDLSPRLRRCAFLPRVVLIVCIVVSQLVLLWTVGARY